MSLLETARQALFTPDCPNPDCETEMSRVDDGGSDVAYECEECGEILYRRDTTGFKGRLGG